MKKLNAITLSLLASLQLTACGGGGGGETTEVKPPVVVVPPIVVPDPTCAENQDLVNGVCVDKPVVPEPVVCDDGQELVNGICVDIPVVPEPVTCPEGQELVNGVCVDIPVVPEPEPVEIADYIDLSGKGISSMSDLSVTDTYAYSVNFSNNRFRNLDGIENIFDGIKKIDLSDNDYLNDISAVSAMKHLEEFTSTPYISTGICGLAGLPLKVVNVPNYGDYDNRPNDFTCLEGNLNTVEHFSLNGSYIADLASAAFLNGMDNLKFVDLTGTKMSVSNEIFDNGNMTHIRLGAARSADRTAVSLSVLGNSFETLVELDAKSMFFEDVSLLSLATKLEVLKLTMIDDKEQTSDFANFFAGMNDLKVLDISSSSPDLKPSVFEDLSSLANKDLEYFDFRANFNTIDHVDASALKTLSKLKTLDLSGNTITDHSFFAGMTAIEDLKISNDNNSESEKFKFGFLNENKNLKRLIVKNTYSRNAPIDLIELSGSTKLEYLAIYQDTTFIENVDLSMVDSMPNLNEMFISWAINDSNISHLYNNKWKNLSLQTNKITDFNLLDNLQFEDKAYVTVPLTFEAGYRETPQIKASLNGKFCQAWLNTEIIVSMPTLNAKFEDYCE